MVRATSNSRRTAGIATYTATLIGRPGSAVENTVGDTDDSGDTGDTGDTDDTVNIDTDDTGDTDDTVDTDTADTGDTGNTGDTEDVEEAGCWLLEVVTAAEVPLKF